MTINQSKKYIKLTIKIILARLFDNGNVNLNVNRKNYYVIKYLISTDTDKFYKICNINLVRDTKKACYCQ